MTRSRGRPRIDADKKSRRCNFMMSPSTEESLTKIQRATGNTNVTNVVSVAIRLYEFVLTKKTDGWKHILKKSGEMDIEINVL